MNEELPNINEDGIEQSDRLLNRFAGQIRQLVRAKLSVLLLRLNTIKTNIAEVYGWLESRMESEYLAAYEPPVDNEGVTLAKNSDNMAEYLKVLNNRKIANGFTLNADDNPSDGIPDGISLAQLLCSTAAAYKVTEIVDVNEGWVSDRQGSWGSLFPYATKITINPIEARGALLVDNSTIEELVCNCETLYLTNGGGSTIGNNRKLKKVSFPKLKRVEGHNSSVAYNWFVRACPLPIEINMPELEVIDQTNGGAEHSFFHNGDAGGYKDDTIYLPKLRQVVNAGYFFGNWKSPAQPKKILFPSLVSFSGSSAVGSTDVECRTELIYTPNYVSFPLDYRGGGNPLASHQYSNTTELFANLIDLWLGEVDTNIMLHQWGAKNVIIDEEKLATMNANIRDHIAARIRDRTGTTALTITFCYTVFAVLEAETIAAFNNKNWNVAQYTW